jgi:hypothetical protein
MAQKYMDNISALPLYKFLDRCSKVKETDWFVERTNGIVYICFYLN